VIENLNNSRRYGVFYSVLEITSFPSVSTFGFSGFYHISLLLMLTAWDGCIVSNLFSGWTVFPACKGGMGDSFPCTVQIHLVYLSHIDGMGIDGQDMKRFISEH
jgi:hypothetical protein